jgi:hypothetical protein
MWLAWHRHSDIQQLAQEIAILPYMHELALIFLFFGLSTVPIAWETGLVISFYSIIKPGHELQVVMGTSPNFPKLQCCRGRSLNHQTLGEVCIRPCSLCSGHCTHSEKDNLKMHLNNSFRFIFWWTSGHWPLAHLTIDIIYYQIFVSNSYSLFHMR